MNGTNMEVMLEMRDRASPQVQAFGQTTQKTMADIRKSNQQSIDSMRGMGASIVANKEAYAELSAGVRYAGTAFLALGVAMQGSNNETIKNMGNTLMMVGAIATVIGTMSGMIDAIGKVIKALRALRVQQILTQAFAGPAGWATLAAGAAVAGGVLYASSRMEGGATRMGGGGMTINNNVTQNIQGSVVTERQLTDKVQKGLLQKGQRNNTTGIS